MKVEIKQFAELIYKTELGECRQVFNLSHIVRVMDFGKDFGNGTLIILSNGETFDLDEPYEEVVGALFGY